jgi:HprK-related kinase A
VSAAASERQRSLADIPQGAIADALACDGLWLDLGAVTLNVRSNSPVLAAQLKAVYGHYPFIDKADWADVHIRIMRAQGLRRWVRPQVVLYCDGRLAFDPFPADSPLPLLEWGANWLVAQRLNDLLLLHAGAVERDGFALLLPAMPGSGKSTLTAALSQRGWRLLSDEFGAYDPAAGVFRAMLKPVALKNTSIEVIRDFAPDAVFGPVFPKTRKGRVAHLAANKASVQRRHETARPGAVVLPQWQAGSPTRWEPLAEHVLFPALSFNAFNYNLLGEAGFRAAIALVRQCPGWQLIYSDLDDALATIDAAWPAILERRAQADAS